MFTVITFVTGVGNQMQDKQGRPQNRYSSHFRGHASRQPQGAHTPADRGMLRKGRFDELFFVVLPNQKERETIWQIQIAKFGRDPKQFGIVQLAKATEGLTGSEIEELFIDSLHEACSRRREPTDLTIAMLLNEFVPLSKLMSEQIDQLRKWAKGRARRATAPEPERQGRKIAA